MSASCSRPHLLIATPCYGGNVTTQYVCSVLSLQKYCLQHDIGVNFLLMGGDALIPRLRNSLVDRFLAHAQATHMLFIDADIGFQPEQVLALLNADKDVCGAVYPLKGYDWNRIIGQVQAGAADLRSVAMNYVFKMLASGETPLVGDFFQARAIGGGFMMIKRAVFGRMAERYPQLKFRSTDVAFADDTPPAESHAFFDCMIDQETSTYLSEDYSFCKRWIDMGGEIWVHAQSRLVHVGTHAFEGDLMLKLQEFGCTLS